jgi:hypothetical protein
MSTLVFRMSTEDERRVHLVERLRLSLERERLLFLRLCLMVRSMQLWLEQWVRSVERMVQEVILACHSFELLCRSVERERLSSNPQRLP